MKITLILLQKLLKSTLILLQEIIITNLILVKKLVLKSILCAYKNTIYSTYHFTLIQLEKYISWFKAQTQ